MSSRVRRLVAAIDDELARFAPAAAGPSVTPRGGVGGGFLLHQGARRQLEPLPKDYLPRHAPPAIFSEQPRNMVTLTRKHPEAVTLESVIRGRRGNTTPRQPARAQPPGGDATPQPEIACSVASPEIVERGHSSYHAGHSKSLGHAELMDGRAALRVVARRDNTFLLEIDAAHKELVQPSSIGLGTGRAGLTSNVMMTIGSPCGRGVAQGNVSAVPHTRPYHT